MKFLSKYPELNKRVNYFGTEVSVSESITYIAVDSNGEVYGYTHHPIKGALMWGGECAEGSLAAYIGTVDLQGMHWTDTLVEV
jgi:hypothetical protein